MASTAGSGYELLVVAACVGGDGFQGGVDENFNPITVKNSDGTMIVHFPPTDLQTLKKGDRITVSLALKDNGPAPK